MIKLSASLSKKTPMPGVEYSSQQFGASMEIEVSDTDRPEAIQIRIREIYGLLAQTIDEQIAGHGPASQPMFVNTRVAANPPAAPSPLIRQETGFRPQPPPLPTNRNGRYNQQPSSNGNGHGGNATQAQQKAIFAIAKSVGLDVQDVIAGFNVASVKDLSIKDASSLIDQLKARQNNNGSTSSH